MSRLHELSYLFGVSGLMTIYGVAGTAVWFLGPSLGFGYTERIILIALILLTWPIGILINSARKRRAERNAEAAEAGDAEPAAKGSKGRAALSAVKTPAHGNVEQGAEEAVQWLRNTKLAGAKDADAVYRLPWFLVAGPPSSGKSSLMLTSGLDFHALPSQRRDDVARLRPTAGAEWRISDDAVMVDTTGDYMADDEDSGGWTSLAETLKKFRKQRPIDGLVLAVSTSSILSATEAENETQAKTLRARLDDLVAKSDAKFPVYLVFTNADSIDGFSEFFSTMTRDERAQAWGATFPLDAIADAHSLFDVEYEYLQEALVRRRLSRLASAETAGEQLRVFDFPLRFADARRKLGAFATALFRPNPFRESPLLRGFYFTSGDASAIDARPWAVDTPGGGFFGEGFVNDILLADRNLAASLSARRVNRLRDVLVSAAAAAIAIFAIGIVVSFVANRRVLAAARDRGEAVQKIVHPEISTDLTSKDGAVVTEELSALDALRETIGDVEEPPLYRRFGLDVGGRLDERLLLIYNDALYPRFVKPSTGQVESDLRTFATTDPSQTPVDPAAGGAQQVNPFEDLNHYDLLRAYLMVSERSDKADANFVDAQFGPYWTKLAPEDDRARALADAQLDFYAARVVSRTDMQRIAADGEIVRLARAKLATYSVESIFLKRVTAEIGDKITPVSLESVGGRSGGWISGDYTVPGAFTLEGYNQMKERLKTVPEDIQQDDWVMASVTAAKGQTADVEKLRGLYLSQYTDHWIRFLRNARVQKFRTRADAAAALAELGAVNSPLERAVRAVVDNTRLESANRGWWAWIFGAKRGPASDLEDRFTPLAGFISAKEGKSGASPLSQYQLALQQLGDTVARTPDEQWEEVARQTLSGKDVLNFKTVDAEVARSIDSLKSSTVADAATLLRQPVENFRGLLRGNLDEQVVQNWGDILPQARTIEAGFPFTPAGPKISVRAIEEFLNPVDGKFTVFFNEKLKASFDDAQGQWKPKEPGKFSEEFVAYLNGMRRLRDALFPNGSQTVKVTGDVVLQKSSGGDAMLEIDGVRVDTRSGPSARFTWPAAQGSSGARIQVYGAQGGEPATLTFAGEWGLYDLFVRGGGPGTKSGTNQYQLSWKVGPSGVRATLTPSTSGSDPFDLELFKLRAPQSVTPQ